MLQIEIRNLTEKRIPTRRILKAAIKRILRLQGVKKAKLNLIFVRDPYIKRLNLKYRKENTATDVLAFGIEKNSRIEAFEGYLGDIAVSLDAAKRQAKIFNSSVKKELRLYVIHGVLHLLGYDDKTSKSRRRMESIQNKLLEKIWNKVAS